MSFSLKEEIYRKIFHLGILILPASYFFFSKSQILYFLLPISVITVALDYYRHQFPKLKAILHKPFSKIMREKEKKSGLTGVSNMLIAAALLFLFADKVIVIVAFTILAISDSAASLVGKSIKSDPFFEKSALGSFIFAVLSVTILVVGGLVFEQRLFYYLFGLFSVFVVTIIEARPSLFGADDNLTIPLGFAIPMMLFGFIWNHSYQLI
ncbi:MAG: hypothetical protein O3B09_01145 [Proteobacteria bacterium]|nr:hypothetical protein [Pseudomonadota bacterium]